MTLAFRTHIDGKPTYFMDKIWHSFPKEIFTDDNFGYDMKHFKIFGNMMWQLTENRPKKHTIREDKKNRWKVGNNIHFVINNRTKKRFQFAPVIPVTCIQQINIDYKNSNNTYPIITISIEGTDVSILHLTPSDHFDYLTKLSELASNDGFDSWQDFLKYFDKDFQGKIIHWTDFKY